MKCNGINYHKGSKTCELISYETEHTLIQQADWSLYLPGRCLHGFMTPHDRDFVGICRQVMTGDCVIKIGQNFFIPLHHL